MFSEVKKNPGLSKDEIRLWIETLEFQKIRAGDLVAGSYYAQLIGQPDISLKLFYVLEMEEGDVTKACVIDVIHNNDLVEYDHHFKWGVLPDAFDYEDLYLVPFHVGSEILNMAQFYAQSENADLC